MDAFPICVDTKDVDKMVETIALISKSFGGINLEDIAAPRCFEVERRLKEVCDIPVFHDDQHGTAIVVAAALLNAMRVTGKQMGHDEDRHQRRRRRRHRHRQAAACTMGFGNIDHVRHQRHHLRGG